MFILFIFLAEEYIIEIKHFCDLAKTDSSSLQSHIAYKQNIRKIKQLKQLAWERGDINIARNFGRLKEESNIKFEQQNVKTFRKAQEGAKCSLVVDSIDIIDHTVLLTCFRRGL